MNQQQTMERSAPIYWVEMFRLVGILVMVGIALWAWSVIPEYWMLWAGIMGLLGFSIMSALFRAKVAKGYRRQNKIWGIEAECFVQGKTTRLGQLGDAFVRNLRGRSGVFIGALEKSLLFVNPWAPKMGAITVIGPARTGKTSTSVIGTLLNVWNLLGKNRLKFSLWVNDSKGELYWVCAAFRKWCGRTVRAINPLGVKGIQQDHFNPLDVILRSVILLNGLTREWCAIIANCMIPEPEGNKGSTDNSFFRQAARLFLMRLMVYMAVFEPFQCHLVRLRELVNSSDKELVMIGNKMRDSDALNGLVRGYGNRMLDEMKVRNFGSIRQEAEQATDIYDSNSDFTKTIMRSDFTLEELLDENSDLFMVLPLAQRESHGAFATLCTTLMIETIARKEKNSKMLMLLDEIGNMPRLPDDTIKKAYSALPSVGLRMATYWQSRAQMNMYGEDIAELIIDQSSVLAAWSIRDPETARDFSRRAGQTTVKKQSYSKDGKDMYHPYQKRYDEKEEALLSETEILQLPDNEMLLWIAGEKMLRCRRVPFWKIGLMRKCAQKNPCEPQEYPIRDTVEWQY